MAEERERSGGKTDYVWGRHDKHRNMINSTQPHPGVPCRQRTVALYHHPLIQPRALPARHNARPVYASRRPPFATATYFRSRRPPCHGVHPFSTNRSSLVCDRLVLRSAPLRFFIRLHRSHLVFLRSIFNPGRYTG